jgi:hypothetical protein
MTSMRSHALFSGRSFSPAVVPQALSIGRPSMARRITCRTYALDRNRSWLIMPQPGESLLPDTKDSFGAHKSTKFLKLHAEKRLPDEIVVEQF